MRRGFLICLGGLALVGAALLRGGPLIIEEITVKGGERIGASQIRAASGLTLGQPWTTSLKWQAALALKRLPGVQDVQILLKRRPGGKVGVDIVLREREPYGLIALSGRGLFWVDREGFVLGKLEGKPYLPVVTGVSTISTPEGERLSSERARRLIEEFFALEGDWLSRVAELRVREYDVELRATEGWRALLAPGGLRPQLAKLDVILSTLEAVKWRTVDLRFEGEVVLGR